MADLTQFGDITCAATATITASGTNSTLVDLNGTALVGIVLPAALDSVVLNFGVALTATGTPVQLFNATGSRVSVAAGASRAISLDPALFAGWRFVRIEAASTETAERLITLITRPL